MPRAFFGASGKRCHAHFCGFRQKMSRNDEGRISRAQSALEQLYQNFCTNTREAGGLPYINQSTFMLVWPGSRDPDERSVVPENSREMVQVRLPSETLCFSHDLRNGSRSISLAAVNSDLRLTDTQS